MPQDHEGQVLFHEITDNSVISLYSKSIQQHAFPHNLVVLKKQMKEINDITNTEVSCNKKLPRIE